MKGQCVIVGVGPKLGRSLVKKFSQMYDVAMVARSAERLREYEQEFSAKAYPANVKCELEFRSTLQDILTHGDPHVLIYNAAIVEKSNFAMDYQTLLAHYQVGAAGAFIAVQELWQGLKKTKGSILFTGGNFATQPHPDYVSLSQAKAGLRSFAGVLQQDHRFKNIYVATIAINGKIAQGTSKDPDCIAEAFYTAHKQRRNKEIVIE